MKRTFVRLSRAKSVNCWLRSGEKSSISKGSRPTCIRVIANCKIDFGRHLFTAHHSRADEANRLQCVRSHLDQRCSRFLGCNWPFDTARPSWAATGEVSIVSTDPFSLAVPDSPRPNEFVNPLCCCSLVLCCLQKMLGKAGKILSISLPTSCA